MVSAAGFTETKQQYIPNGALEQYDASEIPIVHLLRAASDGFVYVFASNVFASNRGYSASPVTARWPVDAKYDRSLG
jgi:hypothetical protein